MGKKKTSSAPSPPSPPPRIYEATCGSGGVVVKGKEITQIQAEVLRRAGGDVVV